MNEEDDVNIREQLNDALDHTFVTQREAARGSVEIDPETAAFNYEYVSSLLNDEDKDARIPWLPPDQR